MSDLACPACGAPGLTAGEAGGFRCEYCGIRLLSQPTQCPACEWHNPEGIEDCLNCGEPLTIVARVLTRQGTVGSPFWIRQLRSRVAALKQQEALASDRRFEQLWEIDQQRIQAEAEAVARQRNRDRQVMLVIGFALAVFVLVAAVAAFALAP